MTQDKDFKRIVRDEARQTGRRYTEVRAEKRSSGGSPARPHDQGDVTATYERLVAAVSTRLFGKDDVVRITCLALVAPGNVLLSGAPGNGMTALADGVAEAIGGRLVSIDGRTGFDPVSTASWRPDDVILISHLDGLEPAAQVAVVEARERPALVLAKRHPIVTRMPFPPDDDIRERFLFGADLDYGDVDTEMRIVDAIRDRSSRTHVDGPVTDLDGIRAMRRAADSVDVPSEVRRFAVEAIAATRTDPQLILGASIVATIDLVKATAAYAAVHGRSIATVDDARAVLGPVLHHRLVNRDA